MGARSVGCDIVGEGHRYSDCGDLAYVYKESKVVGDVDVGSTVDEFAVGRGNVDDVVVEYATDTHMASYVQN
jgi:carbonic anhydrase/acetyltransferase-like protein (isoleucine patch superfamily)